MWSQQPNKEREDKMIYVGIDVAKYKHDCFIVSSDGEVIADVFMIENKIEGFEKLVRKIPKIEKRKIRIGLESTGHYSNNIINYLNNQGYELVLLNPLSTNKFRKAQTLRKTKTDKVDAKIIAKMISTREYKSYSQPSYHIKELKSLTRSRQRLVKYCSQNKVNITRVIDEVFPELAQELSSLHEKYVYAMLLEHPTPKDILSCHLTKLANILRRSSNKRYGKEKAKQIKMLAKKSIGHSSRGLALELKTNIRLVQNLEKEIELLEIEIEELLAKANSPITSIPGIGLVFGSIIISEIGDIKRFNSPAKLLAFSGLEPSTNQSGTYYSKNGKMVKRGSRYLRAALMSAARTVSMNDPIFKSYLAKKRNEGKPYLIALSHVAKKLVRVIFHLLKNNEHYVIQTP